ncbi:hypothetical protein CDD82_5779 [Ophiocordyceps australis]|uniref:SWR1-complex protein 4 n=1 Tax=Ophiocordyceps australis TaxID=1399860 RepID=A0A2C5YZP7_9HYPO|nr:hypothetical protein CDD82_5779 [Ophiocordyceps australis]
MTSSDLREVLNLPDGTTGPRASKKQRAPIARPNLKGLAREVHNLGGDNPIAIVPDSTSVKKRRWSTRKPASRWELRAFHNSGRHDQTLLLRHWRRVGGKEDGAGQQEPQPGLTEAEPAQAEDSAFAKYSVQISVPQYSDEQYQHLLQNDEWTKQETAYLMETVQEYDLRWPVIWDRYDWNPPATNGVANADGDESKAVIHQARSRTMEDLKARYYEIAAKMMVAHKPAQFMTQAEYEMHEIMANYSPQQEKARKDFAISTLLRSREEMREEESLLLEIKRILTKSERFNEERRELYHRLDYPQAEQDISSFKTSSGLQQLLQNLMAVDKSKKRKSVGGHDGISPAGANGPQSAAAESGKRDSAASAGHRDGAGAGVSSSGTNKKGQEKQAQEKQPSQERRKLNAHEEAIYGVTHHERLGSGPTFRTEKINKLFSHKSNQQQIRINNMLNELDIPLKLAMATAVTTAQYELLVTAVSSLLEARKTSDKLDAEIKIEQAKKAELNKKASNPLGGEYHGTDTNQTKSAPETDGKTSSVSQPKRLPNGQPETNGVEKQQLVNGQGDKGPSAAGQGGDAEREKSTGVCRKRSASELSAVSDKSSKRLKK